MPLILKIMNAARGNDDHPRAGHRVIHGVKEVIFREAPDPSAFIWIEGQPEPVIQPLHGSAYVMNDVGKTISRFEVSPQDVSASATSLCGPQTHG